MIRKILDGSALIAYLRNERGAEVVVEALVEPGVECHVHRLNLIELDYDAIRLGGETRADEILADLRRLGLVEHDDLDGEFCRAVARWKAPGGISLADCFGLALAARLGGEFLTADHHEMDAIAAQGRVGIVFIR